MKDFMAYLKYGVGIAIGYMGGVWLYNNVLEDKLDGLKDKCSKKQN